MPDTLGENSVRLVIAALFIALTSRISAPPAHAMEFGTRDEAVAMVKRVQTKVKRDGLDETLRAINGGSKDFNDRDLYAFVVDFTGVNHADAQTPAVRGKNLYDLRDQDGKFIVQDMIAVAKDAGHGWLDYRWLNPATKTIEDKSTYVERMGPNHFVGVGIYKNEQTNVNTIGVIYGSPNSDDTYLQMAYDLADVLNDGDNLRILPIAGIGGPRNIRDVRYVKGIDIGLTQTSILNNFRRSNERMGQTENKIAYIAKLFNEEVHLVARPNISSITQLRGLKVNFDANGSGTSYSMRDIFKALEVDVEEVSMSQVEAFEKVKSGEIAATALIAGKPVRPMSKLGFGDGLHFVPLPYPKQLMSDYLPASLTHDDYPNLVPAGQSINTIAVGAVLISYNWPKSNADRYRRIEKFIEVFFPKIAEFQKPPRHPKWREVNLSATLPGWPRFEAAQAWIDHRHTVEEQPGVRQAARSGAASDGLSQDPLFREFMRWKEQRQRQGR